MTDSIERIAGEMISYKDLTPEQRDWATRLRAMVIGLARAPSDLDPNEGRWTSCSGCYETEDGPPVGSYPYSDILGCTLGGGCYECGGLGAVWDTMNYRDFASDVFTATSATSETFKSDGLSFRSDDAAIVAAARKVCWFDWSDNDDDAVAAINSLRNKLSAWMLARRARGEG